MSAAEKRPLGVRVLPNAVTVTALCFALTGVRFAADGKHGSAVALILAAALFDGLDGRLARMLDATSKMGEELDSLADAISFGVAPALVLYFAVFRDVPGGATGLHGAAGLGWFTALMFAACIVLRLARFNTLLADPCQPTYSREFFVGVPAPAAALVVLVPVILALRLDDGPWSNPYVVAAWTLVAGALAFSRLPTLSLKTLRVPARAVPVLLVASAAMVAWLLTDPWMLLLAATAAYLAHIPVAVRRKWWLDRHPEAWEVAPRDRRALRRALAVSSVAPADVDCPDAAATAPAALRPRILRPRRRTNPRPPRRR